MNKTKSDERSTADLKETFPGSIKCDTKDLTTFQNGFQITARLQLQQTLTCLDLGLVDEKHTVTCDDAESISVTTQKGLSRKFFRECTFKRKAEITN